MKNYEMRSQENIMGTIWQNAVQSHFFPKFTSHSDHMLRIKKMGRGQRGSPASGLNKKIGGREVRQRAAIESGCENVEFRKWSLRITINQTLLLFGSCAVLCHSVVSNSLRPHGL